MDTQAGRALWLLLIRAGVYWQEDVRKLLLSLCMVLLFCREESRLKTWTLSRVLSQTKKVHLYKALVISQVKNWIQVVMIVDLVSIQVMFCPSFPQVSCDQGYWDHVTCGLPFVILCLEITVRQGQQRDAQLSSLPSASHFSLMIKTLIPFFYLSNKHRYVTSLKTSLGNQWRGKASKAGSLMKQSC